MPKPRKTPAFKRPKRPANPYLLFLREQKDVIKLEKPLFSLKEIVKEIACRWKSLPTKDKKAYFDRYRPEKEKYHEEVKDLQKKHQIIHDQTKQDLKTEDPFDVKRKRGRPKKGFEKNVNVLDSLLVKGKKIKIEIKGTITMNLNVVV